MSKDYTKYTIHFLDEDRRSNLLSKRKVPTEVINYLLNKNIDLDFNYLSNNNFDRKFPSNFGDLYENNRLPSRIPLDRYNTIIAHKTKYYICNNWEITALTMFIEYIHNNYGKYITIIPNDNHQDKNTHNRHINNNNIVRLKTQAWPEWNTPDENQIKALAYIAVQFVRFLNPDIVNKLVEDNEIHREEWADRFRNLKQRNIDLDAFLWERCPVAFPGIRRYSGDTEINYHRRHKGHNLSEPQSIKNSLAIDDNDYPKHIWSFIFRGKEFQKQGPINYNLAHLADHKVEQLRKRNEFVFHGELRDAFGLYTSATNTAFIYTGVIKPTDYNYQIRNLLMRKAQELYGDICELFPPCFTLKSVTSAQWSLKNFQWAEPVGITKNIDYFLEFRNRKIDELLKRVEQQS